MMQIIDAHTHFFSYTWLDHFFQLSNNQFERVEDLAAMLSWEMPARDPVELGKKWLTEQSRHGVEKQILFASKLNDAEFLAAATNTYPDKLIGFSMINPGEDQARNQAMYSLNLLGMKGVLLFPALFHFKASDNAAYAIYEEALSAQAVVFVHFGRLNIPIFKKIGLPDNIDLSFSNPLDLQQPALDFPDVNFIVPHFGCGRFEEALQLAAQCPNVFFDTSSSNAWIEPPLTLAGVFEKCLQELGADRLIFGTDSSFFPRGWREDIFQTQSAILDELSVSKKEQQAIFAGNIKRLLGLKEN